MRPALIATIFSTLIATIFLAGCQQAVGEPATTQPAGPVKVKVIGENGELFGPVENMRVVKTEAEWKKQLSGEQYQIARAKGTEQAFTGSLLSNKLEGVYACICCDLPLYASDAKYESNTGWPSFFQPIAKENVAEHVDNSFGMERTEILCARCDAHLGHVFTDGPKPTGMRHCLNSASLKFVKKQDLKTLADAAAVAK